MAIFTINNVSTTAWASIITNPLPTGGTWEKGTSYNISSNAVQGGSQRIVAVLGTVGGEAPLPEWTGELRNTIQNILDNGSTDPYALSSPMVLPMLGNSSIIHIPTDVPSATAEPIIYFTLAPTLNVVFGDDKARTISLTVSAIPK